ncbi:-bisphosphoglycerate-independent phosphoglycerate [Stylonychia lemnae]|uniref:-bisphosphoglycerate-independent phosphoglycerate n=1 Tax=Stylonychia lemnae TaxID=5949 RepID=A0A078BEJ4_STYLE|nr:-bisphosphoglycerate-independent phosphoglycerate [Stylonychia lemnae]|eukprot:CDW91572.1 -bisphosphoglycerate-independent phosphoglycerate [Stylonychia lemnae]
MVEQTQDQKARVKIIFVMIDGLGDNNYYYPEDQQSKTGLCGIHDPVQSGLACGSDTAHMSVFGGRGAFETMGAGVEMSKDDIAFKCNFSYINDENEIVERRRVDRHFDWGIPLCDVLNDMKIPDFEEYIVKCEYATEHRCGLKVTGKSLSSLITGTDPLKDYKKLLQCKAVDENNKEAVFTANLINALSQEIRKILSNHPINLERQKGIGLSFGVQLVDVEGTTGYYNSNLNNKAIKAAEFIQKPEFDYGFVHIKAIDDAGHDKNLDMKVSQLEKLDQALRLLIDELGQASNKENQYIIAVTGDHSTPILMQVKQIFHNFYSGDHTQEPVPIAISLISNIYEELSKADVNNEIQILRQLKDDVQAFNEFDCGSIDSSLGRYCSIDTIQVLKRLKERVQQLLV